MQQHVGGRVQSLFRQTKTWGLDSVKLAQSLYHSWREHPKPLTLLLHDHLENPVAVKLLFVHKEYNLLRYYGFRGYLQHRRNAATALEGEKAASSSSAAKDSPSSIQSVARISFMVTARMKEELVSDLGYSPDFVAKLKPLEASLLLRHQVRDATPEALAELVRAHDEEQELAARKLQEEIEQRMRSEEAQPPTQESQPAETESASASLDSSVKSKEEQSTSAVPVSIPANAFYGSSSSSPLSVTATNAGARIWYELVERVPESGDETRKGEDSVVVMGLYTSEKDALEGLEAHQFLAERNRRPAGHWEVRRTTR